MFSVGVCCPNTSSFIMKMCIFWDLSVGRVSCWNFRQNMQQSVLLFYQQTSVEEEVEKLYKLKAASLGSKIKQSRSLKAKAFGFVLFSKPGFGLVLFSKPGFGLVLFSKPGFGLVLFSKPGFGLRPFLEESFGFMMFSQSPGMFFH